MAEELSANEDIFYTAKTTFSADVELSYAQQTLKRREVGDVAAMDTRYLEMRFFLPICNSCERIFSNASFFIDDSRKEILSAHVGEQLFLLINRTYWDLVDIQSIVNKEI